MMSTAFEAPPPYNLQGFSSPVPQNTFQRYTETPPAHYSQTTRIVTALALFAITATAAYFMLQYGFNRIDFAVGRMDLFVGGVVAYMGTAYAIAAFANLVVPCCCSNVLEACFGEKSLKMQAGVTLLAPLALVPAALCFGLETAVKR